MQHGYQMFPKKRPDIGRCAVSPRFVVSSGMFFLLVFNKMRDRPLATATTTFFPPFSTKILDALLFFFFVLFPRTMSLFDMSQLPPAR